MKYISPSTVQLWVRPGTGVVSLASLKFPEGITWESVAVLEAVLRITKISTTLAQLETAWTGGWRFIIRQYVEGALQKDSDLMVIDLEQIDIDTSPTNLPRVKKGSDELTAFEAQVKARALQESQQRHRAPLSKVETTACSALFAPSPHSHSEFKLKADNRTNGHRTTGQISMTR